MREVLTLQLGNLSNYTATHFWNAQESYFTYDGEKESPVDHNVHWRAGIAADGSDTFLPRTVVYDLKGGFGSMRKVNSLYDEASDSTVAAGSLWPGPSTVYKQPPMKPSAYQDSLDAVTEPTPLTTSTVRYWSDFSRVYFHPKSLVQLYDFELHSSIRPFEKFAMGTELFTSLDKEHDIIDRDWRPFVEECDLMQGMQVFTTLDDAWGGFASSYLEELRDEFPKSCIWVWGAQSPTNDITREKRQLRLANVAQSIHRACAYASMLIPLALPETSLSPQVELDSSSPWHISAMFAALSECALTPSRLKSNCGQASVSDLAEALNTNANQTLASAAIGPLPDAKNNDDNIKDINLFQIGQAGNGNKSKRERLFGRITGYRGPLLEQTRTDPTSDEPQRQIIENPVTRSYSTALQFPLLNSYPHIFTRATGQTDIPVRTILKTDTAISTRMKTLRSQATHLIGLDEREMLSNGIAEIADAYQDDWSSGSDEDDDNS
ncbi:mtDNA inheritance, partitioning of the mitochondrial organelle [Conoideocrella luteorostrata]|uniref:MtDNA inheritance, partitioning of the mitochondrial organelle n=1 Tax=Conoideocrella luteorostrata TaxID=1105319 RepID=A0AAJ0FYQ8_9HYPO|nr:mtDNA inheritance, partitioning of the mitochondrial organelle [Conoideocrella luteorostrata]